jgi:hypothetical protein
MRRLLLVCGAAAALGSIAAPAAMASQARVADGTLRVAAVAGEANDVLVAPAGGGDLAVSDLGAAPDTGPGCAEDADTAVCAGARSIAIALGDGDDSGSIDPGVVLPATIDGGAGSDSLGGGGGPSTLRGGAGDDFLSGGDAADTIDGGGGGDYIVAGGGDDVVLARDGEADSIACGDGQDSVTADPGDTVDGDCERVNTTDPPPAGTGAGPDQGGQPPATTDQPGDGTPAAPTPNAKRRALDFAWCSSHGSKTTLLCSVRLLRRHPSGALHVQLRTGVVAVASGHGRIRNGVARLRLRTRLPVVGGRYALAVTVDRGDRHKRIERTLPVGILAGAPVR